MTRGVRRPALLIRPYSHGGISMTDQYKKERRAQETAIFGWKAIAEMFGVSEKTMISRKAELENCGAIFYMLRGNPKRRMVAAFPSLLKAWISIKSSKGESF